MDQAHTGVRAALVYVSRRWRGLWSEVDAVQDLIEDLKEGEPWASAAAAGALAGELRDLPPGVVIAMAPRSTPERPSLMGLADRLAMHLGGVAQPELVVRASAVPSSRVRRRAGRRGLSVARHAASMAVVGRMPNTPVLVIDDVATSGATLRACEQVLRAAGCRAPITLAAVARSARPPFAAPTSRGSSMRVR